jgi:predicted acyltransferase
MTPTLPEQRLRSLDAFRGATIAGMILVNDPGSWAESYAQLKHAAWSGWTATDMVFPFFLWIMGVAMIFSFAKRLEAGATQRSLLGHAVRRSVIIFVIGLLLNAFPFGIGAPFSFATLRIPGVLQRIAICYLVASILLLKTGDRGRLFWSIGLLAVYWLAVMLIPVPGYGAGVLVPKGNLCWYVDSSLLAGHTWTYAPAEGFDPEGVVSTLPAIVTTLFGMLTGSWLRSERSREEKTVWMFVIGWFMLLAGVILDIWLPINKNMWTSSYAVFMGGWALVCFAVFYWLIDVKGWTRWHTPFAVFGMNAIALYVLSELGAILLWVIPAGGTPESPSNLHDVLYQTLFASWASPLNASLAFAIAYVLLMYLIGWVMWKKRWFIKV